MAKDRLEHIEESNLIQLSHNLLEAVVKSTNILKGDEFENMDKETQKQKLQEAKTVLGFLNATNSTMKTKMQFFRMVGIGDKISAIKNKKV